MERILRLQWVWLWGLYGHYEDLPVQGSCQQWHQDTVEQSQISYRRGQLYHRVPAIIRVDGLSLYAWPSMGRSALHADLSFATLQASEGERPVLVVSYSTQHFRGRPGCLFQVPNCPEPCRDVTERCRVWWTGAAWSIRLSWPKRECLLRLIPSFMDGSCETAGTL